MVQERVITVYSRVSSKNQVTLPAAVRKKLGITPNSRVTFVIDGDTVRVERYESVVLRTAGIFKSNRPPVSIEEEKLAFEMAMAEDAMRRSGGT